MGFDGGHAKKNGFKGVHKQKIFEGEREKSGTKLLFDSR